MYIIPHISWNTKCRMHNIEWPTQDLQAAVSMWSCDFSYS